MPLFEAPSLTAAFGSKYIRIQQDLYAYPPALIDAEHEYLVQLDGIRQTYERVGRHDPNDVCAGVFMVGKGRIIILQGGTSLGIKFGLYSFDRTVDHFVRTCPQFEIRRV